MYKRQLLTVINSKSQWSRVHISEPFEDRIYEIHFPNSDTGYAVGECDCIHKTTDGGETWFDIPLVGIEGLLDVYFVDGNVGYASNPRRFLKTTDGGYTWEDKWPDFMPIANFTEIYFSNEDTGWIAGDFVFSVIRTFDGMDSYVFQDCLLYTSPSPRDHQPSRMPSAA